MFYAELKIVIEPYTDVDSINSYETISKFLSHSMLQDETLKSYHINKSIKGYVWDSPYPQEKDKIYRAGRVYLFHLRSLDLEFILKMKKCLEMSHDTIFKVLSCQMTSFQYQPISQLKSLSPIICTIEKGRYWVKEDGLQLLMDRLNVCALKKYRQYIGDIEEQPGGFIESISLLNKVPIKIPYKSTSLIGNKVLITCKNDDYSQKLAFAVLGAGLEKSSIGFSYFIMDRR